MRRALLIGSPALGLDVSLALERMADLLEQLDFETVEILAGDEATRETLLTKLEHWEVGGDDDCFVYYFGHAGQLCFVDRPPGERRFGAITTASDERGDAYGLILDVELSDLLTRLDMRCGSTSVVLDCCHSGELVRAGSGRALLLGMPTPAWASAALMRAEGALDHLALESSPRIARLMAASPMREAHSFADERGGRTLGHLTRAFVDVLLEVGEGWERLTWDAVAHAVRERVIATLGMESQWVCFAGPRERRLFSPERVEVPRTVGFVHDAGDRRRGWVRTGALTGTRCGDAWRVEGIDGAGVEVVVEGVELNRAQVVLREGETMPGAACWARSQLAAHDRGRRLLAFMQAPSESPLRWTWGRFGQQGERVVLGLESAELAWGERLWFGVEHLGSPPLPWFASIVFVDATGVAQLVSARAPDGIELVPGCFEVIGQRAGLSRSGFELRRPTSACDEPQEASLLLIACRRPIVLSHLVELGSAEWLGGWLGSATDEDVGAEREGVSAPVLASDGGTHHIRVRITSRRAPTDGR